MKELALAKSDGMPDEWWEQLYDFEHAPVTTEAAELARIGVSWPDPLDLEGDDHALHVALSDLVGALAEKRHVYFHHTNHLDDRAFYRRLVTETLHVEKKAVPVRDNAGWQVDLVADRQVEFLRFYASDEDRCAAADVGDVVPERGACPSDRDDALPQPVLPDDQAMMISVPRLGSDSRAGFYFNASIRDERVTNPAEAASRSQTRAP